MYFHWWDVTTIIIIIKICRKWEALNNTGVYRIVSECLVEVRRIGISKKKSEVRDNMTEISVVILSKTEEKTIWLCLEKV